MKRIVMIGLSLASTVVGLQAQGVVTSFSNTSTTLVRYDPMLESPLGGTPVPVGSHRVALYWGVLLSSEEQLIQIGPSAGISPLPGRFTGGSRVTGVATAPGATATFQVRVWASAYSTYEDAVNSGSAAIGKTPLFNSPTGGNEFPPTGHYPELRLLIPTIYVVPEPATITLALFGVGCLWLFRRQIERRSI